MKKTLGFALFILLAIAALTFSVANIVPPAQASWATYGTVTYSPQSAGNPFNQIYHLYDSYYCLYEESNCSVVHPN